jgi:membrane fusion protein (multidrug efflux system)
MAQSDASQAQSDMASAASSYRYNRAVASDTVITAPFSGVVGQKYVALGDYVSPGTNLLTIVDTRILKLVFQVPERYLGAIQMGAPESFTVDSLPGRTFHAETIFIDPAVDMNSRTVTVKAKVLDGDGLIRPGQFGKVQLELSRSANAMTVPEAALVPQGEKFFIYVVRDGKAVLQEIQTGQREVGRVEVVSGLKPGERVVVSGIQKLTDGQPVMEAGSMPPGGPAAKTGPAKAGKE